MNSQILARKNKTSQIGVGVMRIKYVVSTMLFWGHENPISFEQECEFLNSHGFGVELWPNLKGQNECRYARRNWPRLAAATEEMVVTMKSRNDVPTLDQWNEQIACAHFLNASVVTDLGSLGIGERADLNGCGLTPQVIEMAKDNDVQLAIETGPVGKVKAVGEKFPHLSYCLDIGYANLDRVFGFEQYVDQLAPRISHLHLSDNYGHRDNHQPPGLNGGVSNQKWDYLLDVLNKYDNEVIGSFEMCPCTPDVMMRQAGEFLFDKQKWPNRPQKRPGVTNIIYNP